MVVLGGGAGAAVTVTVAVPVVVAVSVVVLVVLNSCEPCSRPQSLLQLGSQSLAHLRGGVGLTSLGLPMGGPEKKAQVAGSPGDLRCWAEGLHRTPGMRSPIP